MRIAILPARGGSKRIKNKNIIEFAGKPMIMNALEIARTSGLFDKIHVSTDSDIIRNIVEERGFPLDFMRNPELADDFAGLVPVLKWVVEEYARREENYEDVCCIFPVAPLLEVADLVKAFDVYEKNLKKYPLLAMTHFPVPIEWAFRRDESGLLTPVSPESITKRSQDLGEAYYESGPFTIFNNNHLQVEGILSKTKFVSYVMPRKRAIDIDTPEDLEFAEALYEISKKKS